MDRIMRTVEKREADSWVKVRMQDLLPEDIFRMFEPTGEAVGWEKTFEWKAMGNPYLNEDNIWTIEAGVAE